MTTDREPPQPQPGDGGERDGRLHLRGAALREAVVTEWNRAQLTMQQIGDLFGRPRATIARILHDARRLGMFVLSVDDQTRIKRQQAAARCHPDYDLRLRAHAAAMRQRRAAINGFVSADGLTRGDISPAEWAEALRMARAGAKYREIADAVKRPLGTMSTLFRQFRAAGLIERRYAEWGVDV